MVSDPLKRRLFRIAYSSSITGSSLQTRLELPQTVLGRKIFKSKIMSYSYAWLNQIEGRVLKDEMMSAYTSMRIGGPADVFIFPNDAADIQTIFKNLSGNCLLVLGEGTNLLVPDKGIRGIVVCLKDSFKNVQSPLFFKTPSGQEKAVLRAGAGVKLSYLAKYAARYSLTGLERLVGIPGSLGGSLIMNAGAEGTEIGQVVRSITRVNTNGEIEKIKGEDLKFHYRRTQFPEGSGIIIEAELELAKGKAGEVHDIMSQHLSRRSTTQPLTLPNSGSVFKNPPGDKAGRLIEDAGLKGYTIGGAGVSIKHANFIVNKDNGSADDVLQLIEHIKNVVLEKSGIKLETEIVIVKS